MYKHIAIALCIFLAYFMKDMGQQLKEQCDYYNKFGFQDRAACEQAKLASAEVPSSPSRKTETHMTSSSTAGQQTASSTPSSLPREAAPEQIPAKMIRAPEATTPSSAAGPTSVDTRSTDKSSQTAQDSAVNDGVISAEHRHTNEADHLPSADVPDYAGLAGKYPQEIIQDRILERELLEKLSLDDMNVLDKNLAVASPAELKEGYVFGSGCATSQCGSEEAAFTVRTQDGSVQVVFLRQGKLKSASTIDDIAQLPPPLRTWAEERLQEQRHR